MNDTRKRMMVLDEYLNYYFAQTYGIDRYEYAIAWSKPIHMVAVTLYAMGKAYNVRLVENELSTSVSMMCALAIRLTNGIKIEAKKPTCPQTGEQK